MVIEMKKLQDGWLWNLFHTDPDLVITAYHTENPEEFLVDYLTR
jgi:hypothetical protein